MPLAEAWLGKLALLGLLTSTAVVPFATTDAFRASPDVSSPSRMVPPLTIAASLGDTGKMKYLIDQTGADVDQFDWLGQTALHMACKFQQVGAARLLLERGANCCIPNLEYEETPLHLAAKVGSLEIIELLIDRGADVNAQISEGIIPGGTPLSYAALYHASSFLTMKLLLERHADPNVLNSQGESVLGLYANQGNIRAVTVMLEYYSADVDIAKKRGCTPLFYLAEHQADPKTWPMMALLLASGSSPWVKCGNSKRTPLHLACANGNKAFVELLVHNGADVNARDRFDRTPLYMAVKFNRHPSSDLVRFLLQNGADPSIKPNDDEPGHVNHGPCNSVVSRFLRKVRNRPGELDMTVLQLLLDHGASVSRKCERDLEMIRRHRRRFREKRNRRRSIRRKSRDDLTDMADQVWLPELILTTLIDNHYGIGVGNNYDTKLTVNDSDSLGRTALHWTAGGEYLVITKKLLDAGANIDAPDKSGYRPIHLAASSGDLRIVRLLVQRGAKLNDFSMVGTPVRLAIETANSAEVVEELLRAGAPLGLDTEDPPLLHLAAVRQNPRMIPMLIEAGARINAKSVPHHGRTAFSSLIFSDCCYPQIPVLRALLENGADIDSRDDDGNTPLMVALKIRKRKEVILFLIENGADVNAVDAWKCNSPLYIAVAKASKNAGRYHKHSISANGDEEDVAFIIRHLVAAGADPTRVDQCSGKTVIQLAHDKNLSQEIKSLLS